MKRLDKFLVEMSVASRSVIKEMAKKAVSPSMVRL